MRRFHWLLLLTVTVLAAAACNSTQPAEAPAAPAPSPFRPIATIQDIMNSQVDPAADAIWNSVATIVSVKGTEERRPRTDEEWANVRHAAIRLLEGTNLLAIDGRQVARPGFKSENPGIELEPEEMEKLIKDDRATYLKLSQGLYDATLPALKAIDAKNADALLDAGEIIDQACEACHQKYWYPNSPPPPPIPAAPPGAKTP
jgi:hypothetical protein